MKQKIDQNKLLFAIINVIMFTIFYGQMLSHHYPEMIWIINIFLDG